MSRPDSPDSEQPRTIAARWLFPVDGQPIENGGLTIAGGRILEVGPARAGAEDLGNVAILPGLVNAHTHLDLSDLAQPLGEPGEALPDWIRRVIAWRRSGTASPAAAVACGLEECRRFQTAALADIVQPGGVGFVSCEGGPATLAMLELIAPTAKRVEPAIELARQFVTTRATGCLSASAENTPARLPAPSARATDQPSAGARLSASVENMAGLSPHSPYTVHPRLLEAAVALSASHHLPLAMHLAESPEEIELLRSGGGLLRTLLEELGAWDAELVASESRPLDYLRTLSAAHRVLVIHGNYLDDEEAAFLAGQRDRMTLVYCPRTHARFGHPPYRLAERLAAGVAVALGTDSRASSPDLDLFAEMRHVARSHPNVALATVLELGTLAGARALGIDDQLGTLAPGKLARLAVVPLAATSARDPHRLLFGLGDA